MKTTTRKYTSKYDSKPKIPFTVSEMVEYEIRKAEYYEEDRSREVNFKIQRLTEIVCMILHSLPEEVSDEVANMLNYELVEGDLSESKEGC